MSRQHARSKRSRWVEVFFKSASLSSRVSRTDAENQCLLERPSEASKKGMVKPPPFEMSLDFRRTMPTPHPLRSRNVQTDEPADAQQ